MTLSAKGFETLLHCPTLVFPSHIPQIMMLHWCHFWLVVPLHFFQNFLIRDASHFAHEIWVAGRKFEKTALKLFSFLGSHLRANKSFFPSCSNNIWKYVSPFYWSKLQPSELIAKVIGSCQCLRANNFQKWKSRFLTCPCHKIDRVAAVGLSISNNTLKIMILWICEIWGHFVKSWYFVNNCFIKVQI